MRFTEEEIKKLERELLSHGITWAEFEEQYQARKWYELPASEVTCLAVNEIEPKNSELARLCTKLFAFPKCALDTLQKAKLNVLKDFIYEAFGRVRGMSKWKKADFVQYAFKRFSEKYAEKPETEAEDKLLNGENLDGCQEEITKIHQVMAGIENKTYFQKINVLEKCSEAFLWDMCRAYGVTPNDNKGVMTRRILNCEKTTAEKIEILKQILPDVRIAFNCWTDNGKLSVNEAYEQSLKRLEAWLMFLSRKEKKS